MMSFKVSTTSRAGCTDFESSSLQGIMSNPILSICIPTYNRATILKDTLHSIISQNEFKSGKVEIVVSDNCSSDNTREVCKEFEHQYQNFHYYRNSDNLADKNFPIVLSEATGIYRKLFNDTCKFLPGSLQYLIGILENGYVTDNHPLIYYMGKGDNPDIEKVDNMSDFIRHVSYWITWIGGVGIWEEDADILGDSIKYSSSYLWQVPLILNLIIKHNQRSIIINKSLVRTTPAKHQFNTNWFHDVYYTNYWLFRHPCG